MYLYSIFAGKFTEYVKERMYPIDFINLTTENLGHEHLYCIIRHRKPHPGIDKKRQWLADRLTEGHIFRKLNVNTPVFIEYAPLETAWVPITGHNYYYLYCLWVSGPYKGKGYAKSLMEYCIADAKQKGKSGICMLGAKKQKSWLSNQSFARKFSFEAVDSTKDGYELLAVSFDGTTPQFGTHVKIPPIEHKELTIYYDHQCPYIHPYLQKILGFCHTNRIPLHLIEVDSLQKAKNLPCVFNNWALFYKGHLQTVNLIDPASIRRLLKKQ